ncbi:metalloregulator ArsR/SmtB family transcription factor [Paenibacillus melissococcoides]|uniref:Metalloregulator ArsR/SmtB family transcription factor n=1 Tax=Paenibacillus melissococcoides TaxID=2912268 RepID=A0ABM9FXZ0_9BACL|nr:MULTISPECIES: metalloregulator ArsR/SmtB family transcription factor [Paenibacillus]MEB9893358.1 metalloregulator ArsR/SmtB family transcription factor [Bacillus cereus]CAH8244099.1 metalloregulator ArsR/SmtB family transcription factor [Paenibacillus melissococcoides]CAH8703866.1 metalloregulator ArsR/SmtB family transcription factor [Paenibacillus melissococcoides]CAH8706458.1 metalloregulator ArsR/SmtB family transcription factor [Paenibacillus melissococcoides]GIO79727.1 transcriptional
MSSSAPKYDVFQAIADPTRREVLRLLADKELPISQITSHFPISRTAIAKHLHILTEADLVSGRKAGREKIYRLHPEPLTELKDWLSFYERFWNNKLSILKHVVEQEASSGLPDAAAEKKDRH